MPTTDRVKQILSNYPSDNPGTLTNLHRLLMTGTLAGTGKLVILPVDQGFEHGPLRSFGPNPDGNDPDYRSFNGDFSASCPARRISVRARRPERDRNTRGTASFHGP